MQTKTFKLSQTHVNFYKDGRCKRDWRKDTYLNKGDTYTVEITDQSQEARDLLKCIAGDDISDESIAKVTRTRYRFRKTGCLTHQCVDVVEGEDGEYSYNRDPGLVLMQEYKAGLATEVELTDSQFVHQCEHSIPAFYILKRLLETGKISRDDVTELLDD